MSIVNSVATFQPDSSQLIQRVGVAIATAAPQTVTVPAAGTISPALARGKARAKFYNQTTAITITGVQLNGLDGTNTVTLQNWSPSTGGIAITATAYLDVTLDFLLDTTTAGGGASGSLIFPGATTFNFLVTSTGASGACSGDFEIAGEP